MIPELSIEVDTLINQFRLNHEAMHALIKGPIAQDLVRRAIRVTNAAKRNATHRPGPNVITGRLRNSITWRLGADSYSPYVDVGSAVHYAPYVELGHGNTPHVYPIFTPGGTFTGDFGFVGSGWTPAYPFLRPALIAAAGPT